MGPECSANTGARPGSRLLREIAASGCRGRAAMFAVNRLILQRCETTCSHTAGLPRLNLSAAVIGLDCCLQKPGSSTPCGSTPRAWSRRWQPPDSSDAAHPRSSLVDATYNGASLYTTLRASSRLARAGSSADQLGLLQGLACASCARSSNCQPPQGCCQGTLQKPVYKRASRCAAAAPHRLVMHCYASAGSAKSAASCVQLSFTCHSAPGVPSRRGPAQ